jgi:hypothetical protein
VAVQPDVVAAPACPAVASNSFYDVGGCSDIQVLVTISGNEGFGRIALARIGARSVVALLCVRVDSFMRNVQTKRLRP